jgi:phosphatidylinositol glycan class C protein
MITALLLVLFYGSRVETKQNKHVKLKQRATDVLLSAILLRFLASLLQSLTASYASDTMYALVMAGFVLHVLACDYSYANGHARYKDYEHATKRPIFHGGTVSLNSALFSTTLLVSRLQIVEAYFFVYFAVVLFAFYPVTRNIIAVVYPARKSGTLYGYNRVSGGTV